MNLTPDSISMFTIGTVSISATVFFTWVVMGVLTCGARIILRRSFQPSNFPERASLSRSKVFLEIVVQFILSNLTQSGIKNPEKYIGFVGTLFIFIAVSGVLEVFPLFIAPTSSLSTTAALALTVFVAVPVYAIQQSGLKGYLRHYVQPSFLMLPFHLMSDVTRTLALAVRLFGNMMSGTMITGILISVAPFIFPVLFHILGLITSLIQAYIFSVLTIVYISAVTQTVAEKPTT